MNNGIVIIYRLRDFLPEKFRIHGFLCPGTDGLPVSVISLGGPLGLQNLFLRVLYLNLFRGFNNGGIALGAASGT